MIETTTKEALRISSTLSLPRSMITHVAGILAMRGMGKSYLASVLMEEMVSQGLFVGFVDPLGIAWGIRASADGEHEGLNVLIFGGRHADVPLDPAAGKIVAQAVLELRQPFILDLSLFDTEDEQRTFIADFIEAFRPCENVLLHMIIDESDIFAPQMPQSGEAHRSLRAMNALARRYRYKGIGATFICQRPAELHKGVMQFDLLLALCMTQPHDIKAVDTWIKNNATAEERATFLSTLASLPVGIAWAWSPRWLRLFERVTIRTRFTYDSSRTPDVDSMPVEPKHLAEIDLSALSRQIEALMTRARETDPARLRLRIQELEGQLRDTKGASPSEQTKRGNQHVPNRDAELTQAKLLLAEKEREIKLLQQKCADLEKLQASVNGTNVPLADVPNYLRTHGLHIDTATITIGRAKSEHPSDEEPPRRLRECGQAVVAPSHETTAHPGGSSNVGGISDQEQKTLSRLLKKMEQLTGNERAIFTWLLTHDQQWITGETLATALCISVHATRADRTRHLDKIEFIHRSGGRLRANFAEYAQVAFGSARNIQAVKQALLHAAR